MQYSRIMDAHFPVCDHALYAEEEMLGLIHSEKPSLFFTLYDDDHMVL
jgi:hypothetical protein